MGMWQYDDENLERLIYGEIYVEKKPNAKLRELLTLAILSALGCINEVLSETK